MTLTLEEAYNLTRPLSQEALPEKEDILIIQDDECPVCEGCFNRQSRCDCD